MSSITDVPFIVDKKYKILHPENISDMINDIKFNNNHNPISINGKPVLENLKK
jgi:hypothetical protein